MKKPWQKTSSMEGIFARKPILDKTNSRITLSNESATDDIDKIDMPRLSLKQKLAALAALLTAMNGFAYCHNTAEAPVSSETAATAEPFGQSGREVEFTTPDGEIDVKKVDREVLHGITTRYTELQGKTKTDRYMDNSLVARQTDKGRGIEEIIAAKRATASHDGQNVVVTTVTHKQKDTTTGKTTTREEVTLETPQEPGAAQPAGELTTAELLQITGNPATEVAAASSFRPSGNTDPNKKLYTQMTRTTNENGAPTFAIEEASANTENPDDIPSDSASWQSASSAGTNQSLSDMLQFWCV
ncbi:MAG: hypothetical protein Q4B27_00925 [Candidatus Saccharibacteria bacterium]|nr:hypothetical protein [Candidatus Saccharibacteria bacterium]